MGDQGQRQVTTTHFSNEPCPTVIKNNVRNVSKPMEWAMVFQTPGNGYPEQFFMIQDAGGQ